MNCDVVRDLIPLVLDGVASPGSAKLVEEHTASCKDCRVCLERAGEPLPRVEVELPRTIRRVDQWRSSVLQSVLFLVYFAVLTVGVALEARTPSGLMNGFWGFALVVPAAGFLLSLVNWYFVRLYPDRRSFVRGSVVCTAMCLIACFGWALWHYGYGPAHIPAQGLLFTAADLVLSLVLSGLYAALIGKE